MDAVVIDNVIKSTDLNINNKPESKFYKFCIKVCEFFKVFLTIIFKPILYIINLISRKITSIKNKSAIKKQLEFLKADTISATDNTLDKSKIASEAETLTEVILQASELDSKSKKDESYNTIQTLNSKFDEFFINKNLTIEEKIATFNLVKEKILNQNLTTEIAADLVQFINMAKIYCFIDDSYQKCLPPNHDSIPLYKTFISQEILTTANNFNGEGCFAFECKTGYIFNIIRSYITLLQQTNKGTQITFNHLIAIANQQNALIPTSSKDAIDIAKDNWEKPHYFLHLYSDNKKHNLNQILIGRSIEPISDGFLNHEGNIELTNESEPLLNTSQRKEFEVIKNHYNLDIKLQDPLLENLFLLPNNLSTFSTLGDDVFNLVKEFFAFNVRFGHDNTNDKNLIKIKFKCASGHRIGIMQCALTGYYSYLDTKKPETREQIVKHAYGLCSLLRRIQPYTDQNTRLLFVSLFPALLAEQGLMLTKAAYDNPRDMLDLISAEEFWDMIKNNIVELPKIDQKQLDLLACTINKIADDEDLQPSTRQITASNEHDIEFC